MARSTRLAVAGIAVVGFLGVPSAAASARPGGHGQNVCQARAAKLQAKEQKLAEKGKGGGAGLARLQARANRHCRS